LRAFDAVVRVAGACVAATLGAMTALLEAFATPRHWIIPIAAALVGNLLLFWFGHYTIARVWAWIVPAVPWFLVMILAVASTGEGDLIANSWTGLATFAAGAAGFFLPAAFPPPSKARGLVDHHGQNVEGLGP